MTSGDKTWKFTLEDSKNADIFYEKLKNQKTIEVTFYAYDESGTYKVFLDTDPSFGFVVSDSASSGWDKNYIIIGGLEKEGEKILGIVVQNDGDSSKKGFKIGEIVKGMAEPSELDSLFEQTDSETGVKFTFSYEPEESSVIAIVIVTIICMVASVIFIIIYIFILL